MRSQIKGAGWSFASTTGARNAANQVVVGTWSRGAASCPGAVYGWGLKPVVRPSALAEDTCPPKRPD